jgi:hypothetical protein
MEEQIRLDDLLARDLDVRWFEGVALIQAVCRQTTTRRAPASGFPSAAEILLDATGAVSAPSPGAGGTAVAAAGHLLARMLTDDVPVRLRLLVTQATAAAGGYATLEEFSTALSYFERPDGQEVLKSLFDRAAGAPRRSADIERHELPPTTDDESLPDDDPDAPRQPQRSRWLVVATLATGATLLVALVYAFGGSSDRRDGIVRGLDALARAVVSRPSAEAPTPPPTTAIEHEHKVRSAGQRHALTASPVGSPEKPLLASTSQAWMIPSIVSEVSWVPLLAQPDGRLTRQTLVPQTPMVFYSTVEIAASAPGAIEPDPTRVYSRADIGVIPPRSVYPKLPDESMFGPILPNQTVLELVIGSNGIVEHVKLQTPPRNIHEFMLVSAAKAWQFEPARLDGHPVRFRHRVNLTVQ